MSDKKLVDSICRELNQYARKRILIRNVHDSDKIITALESMLDDVRILNIDCSDNHSLRHSLLAYFTGDGLPEIETAYEAGWRSHSTEVTLVSGREGLEIAAGLQAIKERIKDFLLREVPLDEHIPGKLFASFAWSLPTLICFSNYSGKPGSPAHALQSEKHFLVPPVIVLRDDSGEFAGADSVLESGMMSPDSIEKYLSEIGCPIPVARVIRMRMYSACWTAFSAGIPKQPCLPEQQQSLEFNLSPLRYLL